MHLIENGGASEHQVFEIIPCLKMSSHSSVQSSFQKVEEISIKLIIS